MIQRSEIRRDKIREVTVASIFVDNFGTGVFMATNTLRLYVPCLLTSTLTLTIWQRDKG